MERKYTRNPKSNEGGIKRTRKEKTMISIKKNDQKKIPDEKEARRRKKTVAGEAEKRRRKRNEETVRGKGENRWRCSYCTRSLERM